MRKDAVLDGVFQAVLLKHPRTITLFATRPAVSPASIERVEEMLAVLRAAGFSVKESLRVFHAWSRSWWATP